MQYRFVVRSLALLIAFLVATPVAADIGSANLSNILPPSVNNLPVLANLSAFSPDFPIVACESLTLSGNTNLRTNGDFDFALASNKSLSINGNLVGASKIIAGPMAAVTISGKVQGSVERSFADLPCGRPDFQAVEFEFDEYMRRLGVFTPTVNSVSLVDQSVVLPMGIFLARGGQIKRSRIEVKGATLLIFDGDVSFENVDVVAPNGALRIVSSGKVTFEGRNSVSAIISAKSIGFAGVNSVEGALTADSITTKGTFSIAAQAAVQQNYYYIGGERSRLNVLSSIGLIRVFPEVMTSVVGLLEAEGMAVYGTSLDGTIAFSSTSSGLASIRQSIPDLFVGSPFISDKGWVGLVSRPTIIVEIDFSAGNSEIPAGWQVNNFLGKNFFSLTSPAIDVIGLLADVEWIKTHPAVRSATIDYWSATGTGGSTLPNDYNQTLDGQWNLDKIDAPEAWQFFYGGLHRSIPVNTVSADSNVGIVDEGIVESYTFNRKVPGTWSTFAPVLEEAIDLKGTVTSIHKCQNDSSFGCIPRTERWHEYEDHGIHVAGIIGPLTHSGSGIAGLRWGIPDHDEVTSFSFTSACDDVVIPGSCALLLSEFIALINHMADGASSGNRIVNMSLGGTNLESDQLSTALANLAHCGGGEASSDCLVTYNSTTGSCTISGTPGKGTLLSIAAGNQFRTHDTFTDEIVEDPCTSGGDFAVCYPGTLSVKSCFANHIETVSNLDTNSTLYYRDINIANGYHTGSNKGLEVSLTAPGVDIVTNHIQDNLDEDLHIADSGLVLFSGTSAAAPHVTALGSLLFKLNPNFSVGQVTALLENNASRLGNCTSMRTTAGGISRCRNDEFGFGVIEADKTVIDAIFQGDPSPSLDVPTNLTVIMRDVFGNPLDNEFTFTLANNSAATGTLYSLVQLVRVGPVRSPLSEESWIHTVQTPLRTAEDRANILAVVAPGQTLPMTFGFRHGYSREHAINVSTYAIKACYNTNIDTSDLIQTGVPTTQSEFISLQGICEEKLITVSFEHPPQIGPGTPPPEDENDDTGTTCFTSQALKGTDLAPEITTLRAFRDKSLEKTMAGRGLTSKYYRVGPEINQILNYNALAKKEYRDLVRQFKDSIKAKITIDVAPFLLTNQEVQDLEAPLAQEEYDTLLTFAQRIEANPIASQELKEASRRGRAFIEGRVGQSKGALLEELRQNGL